MRAGRVGLVIVLAAVVTLPVGVGATVAAKAPKADEPIKKTAAALPDAIASKDCEQEAQYFLHSIARASRNVSEPVPADECSDVLPYVAELEGLKIDRSKQFGTAAEIEGHIGKNEYVFVFAIDIDGAWRLIAYLPITKREIGSTPLRGAKNAAENFIDAIRDEDCPAVWRSLNRESSYVLANPEGEAQFCEGFETALNTPGGRPAEIATARDGDLISYGGSRTFAFFGVDLPSGMFITILVAKNAVSDPEHAHPSVLEYATARSPKD